MTNLFLAFGSEFDRYVAGVRNIPLLSEEEEKGLGYRSLSGDKTAQHEMVRRNLMLPVFFLHKHSRYRSIALEGIYGVEAMDFIQEGNIALFYAARKFNPGKGCFSTIAEDWIVQRWQRFLLYLAPVRQSYHAVMQKSKVRHAYKRLLLALGRVPTDEELAKETGVSLWLVREEIGENRPSFLSLNRNLRNQTYSERGMEVGEMIPDRQPEVADVAETRLLLEQVLSLFGHLTAQERQVLELRYGLRDGQFRTHTDVAEVVGRTRQRVHMVEQAALVKLRKRMGVTL